MNRSATVSIIAISPDGTPTRESGRMRRSRPSVRSTGVVVSVSSEVPTTSRTMRAAKNSAVPQPRRVDAEPARRARAGVAESSASAWAASVKTSRSAMARKPRSATRHGTRESPTVAATSRRERRQTRETVHDEQRHSESGREAHLRASVEGVHRRVDRDVLTESGPPASSRGLPRRRQRLGGQLRHQSEQRRPQTARGARGPGPRAPGAGRAPRTRVAPDR